MAWTNVVIKRTKRTGTDFGLVQAWWDKGGPEEYMFQERLELIAANLTPFVARATTAKDAELAERTWAAGKSTLVLTALNG